MVVLRGKPVTSRRPAALSHRARPPGLSSTRCPSPPDSHLSGRGPGPIVELQRGWSTSSALRQLRSEEEHPVLISNPFPSSSCSSSNPLSWKAMGRVTGRVTLHIQSHLPSWRGHLGPENKACLTEIDKHKMGGVGNNPCLTVCFLLSLQVRELQKQGSFILVWGHTACV